MTDAVAAPAPETTPGESGVLIGTEAAPIAVPAVPPTAVNTESPVQYEPTGDIGMDMALEFVGNAGFAQDHPAMQAAANGDFSILEALLAQKGVAGYEKFVALGKAAYTRSVEASTKATAAIQELAHKAAGGEQEWNAVRTWAGANASDAEKTEINALLNKGGLAAKGAVTYLVDAYNRANNVEVTPKDPTAQAGRGGVPGGENKPLDAMEYSRAVQALNNKLNGRLEGSPEYAKLQARRLAYRG